MSKAVVLFSGGLDSTLATLLLLEQSVRIEGLHFISLFNCTASEPNAGLGAKRTAAQLGIPLKIENNTVPLFEIIKAPRYGYGSNMNPCIDCRIRSFRRAGEIMREIGADFIATGEVLGERPMSQRRGAMETIVREAGIEGLVLRPLSAKLMEPTIPENKGWVDREKLLRICGRCRKPQFELAAKFGIKNYPTPAGGCLLTDPEFSARMRDLLSHKPNCDVNDAHLLKVGRHFRPADNVKIIVGRNQRENGILLSFARAEDFVLEVTTHPGPITLVCGTATEDILRLAASITMRYGKAVSLGQAPVHVRQVGVSQSSREIIVGPAEEATLGALRIAADEGRTKGRRTHGE